MASEGAGGRLVESQEADGKGLELGREQGEAVTRTIRHMVDDVAQGGEEIRSGDYLIAYAVEEAEGMHVPDGGDLRWQEPEEDSIRIEVAVRDAADGRLIPGLEVVVTVSAEDGAEIGTHRHPLVWYRTSTPTAGTGSSPGRAATISGYGSSRPIFPGTTRTDAGSSRPARQASAASR